VNAFEFTVAKDLGIGVVDLEGAEQGDEGCTLGWGACVGWIAFLVQAAFVTNADGVGVVVAGVHTDLVFRASQMDLAVFLNEVVVANAFSVETGVVTGAEHTNGKPLI